jgi:RHS repeat-associated protein
MLGFITPKAGLVADSSYTISINGSVDPGGAPVLPATITFTTAHVGLPVPDPDGEDWNPPATGTREDWRTNRKDSDWRSLPPLQAAPGVTAVAGQALTLNGKPLTDVTMKVGDKTARTDDTGRFLIENIESGHRVLVMDGRTANKAGKTYGVFEAGVEIEASKTTALRFTIWMPKLDTIHEIRIPSPTTAETVVTTPLIPGLEVHIPAGTVIRDVDGNRVKKIGITPIPLDRPPFPLPKDVYVPIYFTVQPGGAYIESSRGDYVKGARLFYPNYRGEGSGTRFDFWHYDPEDKGWYVYGKGTVAQDQQQIIPDAGVSVHEFTGAMVALPSTAPADGPGKSKDGDPVDLWSGLFVLTQTDLMLPDTIPISVTRTYRPRDSITRAFGIGTTHAFEIFLIGDTNPWTYIELVLPDGGRIHYDRISTGTSYTDAVYEHTSTPSAFYKSRVTWDASIAWNLTLRDGTVYTFRAGDGATVAREAGLMSIRDRYGNTITATRDSSSRLTKLRSPNGRFIDFTYDASNRVTQIADNVGRTVSYAYDANGRLWKVTDPLGGVTEFAYDSSHRMTSIKDARGTTYLTNEYDGNGRVTRQTLPDGGIYQFAYTLDGNNKVIQTDVTTPLGNVRRVSFNSDGFATSETLAPGTSNQQLYTFEIQSGTNFVLSATDALGRKATATYDSVGNVASITRMADTPSALTTTFTYDAAFNQLASATDPLNHTTTFSHDGSGNLITVTDPLGNQGTYTYNSAGQILTYTNAEGKTMQYSYDGGDLVRLVDPLGNSITRFLDSAGRTLSLTNALGHTIRLQWDALNRQLSTTDSLQGSTNLSYDPNSNVLSVTDPRGKIVGYTYDAQDRVSTQTDPLGHASSLQYDLDGNISQSTDRKGQITTYIYDSLDRVILITFADSSTIRYSYDAANRVTQIADSASGSIAYTYDNFDRLSSETTALGTVGYTYDAANRLATLTVPGQAVVSYTYDNCNRWTQISQGPSAVAFAYDRIGRTTSRTLPNGVVTEYSYDDASHLTSIAYKKNGIVLGNLTYEFDAAGERVRTGGSYARTGLPSAVSSTAYDDANRQTSFGSQTLTYDLNGSLTGDGVNTYTWNARNQLVSINGPELSASFEYDGAGRRAIKTINGVTTAFLYDGQTVVQEQSGGSATANLLVGGLDEFFTRSDGDGTFSPLVDALGSAIALSDASGMVHTQYTYDPFGNTSVTGTSSENRLQYTGRENDATGLYYYRARYYSPSLGHFISEDPLKFASGDANFYVYVWNSPTNWNDPTGLRPGDRYHDIRCAGWNAIRDINMTSRHTSPAWPHGREYGGWIYRNPDGTYSYTAPAAGGAAGIQINQFTPIPAGATVAGDYHTHGAYDPAFNGQGINPGQPGYNWRLDGNEIFSGNDMASNETEGPGNTPVPGFLGTPRGTTEEYIPIPGHPGQGHVVVLTKEHCGCPKH